MPARRTRRRLLAAAVWMVVGALVLTGCASGAPDAGDSSGGSSLRMFSYEPAESAELLRTQLAAFSKETGIEVQLDTLPGSGAAIYPDKLRTELLGGNAPDIWRIWGGEIGAPFARAGQAADLGPYYEKYGWDEKLNPNAVAGMTIDRTKYGVPLWSAALGAWYNKQVFQKAGVEVPTTYAELEQANAKLAAAGVTPLTTGGKYGWHIMRLFEYLLEVTAGPELHDRLLIGEASWNDPAVVEAFELFVKWQKEGWLPDGVLGLNPDDVEPSFVQGSAAYTITGQWAESTHILTAGADPADYGTFVLPTGHEPQRYSGFIEGYMIAESSPNKDAAAQLIEFLMQPEQQRGQNNNRSTVLEATPDKSKLPHGAEWARIQQEAPSYVIQDQAFPKDLADGYFKVQSDVLQGNITPQQAAEQMDTLVSQWEKDGS